MKILRLLSLVLTALALAAPAMTQINTVQSLAPGVYFHQGDPRRGHSNNGWLVFDDFVVVIEANFPSGTEVIMPRIKETTDKPVRFVFNTHHHGDHAYGSRRWAELGATVLSSSEALAEMRKVETGYFGGAPGRWEDAARLRPDVAATSLKPPVLLFPQELVFDDGQARVELVWLGVGHTRGDAYAWLPQEKILFTGDACVNGPHNYMDDANIAEWIKTLERVKQLGAVIVCPGHGPRGGPEIIADQQAYLSELYRQVKVLVEAGKSAAEIKAAAPGIAAEIKKTPNIARYVPSDLTRHVQKAYLELGGTVFPK
jgi:cyclase